RQLAPWLPPPADALADGAWTAAWPGVAAVTPLVALALGFLAPLLLPGLLDVYTESLPFMLLLVAAAILSGPAGLGLLLGYVLGMLVAWPALATLTAQRHTLPVRLVLVLGGQAITWVLLAIPALLTPQRARQMAEERVAVLTLLTVLVLAGVYESVVDPLLVAVVVGALGAWRAGLLGRVPGWWVGPLARVPALLRLVAAPLIAYVVAGQVLQPYW